MDAFNVGPADAHDDDGEQFSDVDLPGSNDGSSADTAQSSGIHPPSSDAGRQSVILDHLNEPPIIAMVRSESYEPTMSEIARHFARHRDDLVDAYEIGSPPLDTPQLHTSHCAHD